MRVENRTGEGECYQVNASVKAVYSDRKKTLTSLEIHKKKISDDDIFSICMQGFHFNNAASYLGITSEDLVAGGNHKVVTTSARDVLEEYLKNNQNLTSQIEGRLIYT